MDAAMAAARQALLNQIQLFSDSVMADDGLTNSVATILAMTTEKEQASEELEFSQSDQKRQE